MNLKNDVWDKKNLTEEGLVEEQEQILEETLFVRKKKWF